MNEKKQPAIRLLLAFLTAALLAWLLPLGMFAFTVVGNNPATWSEFQPAAGAWQNASTILTSVVVTDTDGLTNEAAYQYSADGVSWSEWMTQNLLAHETISTTYRLTITAIHVDDGVNYIRYAITDALGTREISPEQEIRVDTQAPDIPENVSLTPTGWQTAGDASWILSWTNPQDISGIVRACYKVGAPPLSVNDGVCVTAPDITRIEGIRAPAEGQFDVHLWLQDAAGNSDLANQVRLPDGLQWDMTPPTVFFDFFGPLGDNDWYTDTILANIVAVDNESGLDATYYNLDGAGWVLGGSVSIVDDGAHTIVGRAIDVAGNAKETEVSILKLDKTPPTTVLNIDGAPNALGWYETPVTLTFLAEDVTSGVASTWWRLNDGAWRQGTQTVVSEDGQYWVRYFSQDHAGNIEPTQEYTIQIDQLPPTTSYAVLSPNGPTNGWYNEPVTITLVAMDDGIGVQETYYRINGSDWQTGTSFQLVESGDYEIEFYSVDQLGHRESISSIPGGVHIDTRPPQPPIPLDVNPRGWTNVNDFNLLLALPPNDLSGIAGAYVKIGQPPLSPIDGQWYAGANSMLNDIQTPAEGEFNAYVWLQDMAGNVDHGNYAMWTGEMSLKYDATPPVTQLAIAGEAGENGWYTSPVTVTFLPDDALSGAAMTQVSIDGSDYITATSLSLDSQDKHVLRYFSRDHAGNQESTRLATIRIDYEAPTGPEYMGVQPFDWTLTNTFTLTWTNPPDLSGIAAAYYKIGTPPEGPRDGVRIPPTGVAEGISVPGEGAWDIYLWLEDVAGNVDQHTRSRLSRALRYDVTSPSSVLTILEGTLGADGWYVSPVQVLISPKDDGSGPAGVRFRIDGGEWQYAEHEALIELKHTGLRTLEYQAIDVAGNKESVQQAVIKIDLTPPMPRFLPMDRYQRQTSFVVSWQGVDQADGSGLSGFDLQYRDGRNGAWLLWGAAQSPETSRRFNGSYGHRYFFRMRAYDRAGNVSEWVEMPWGVYVDRLQDGDFAGGDFGVWEHGGMLVQDVLRAPGPDGDVLYVAQLGSPDYGPNNDISQPGNVPVGTAAITQTIRIPGPDVLDKPVLTFWYRIRTYDAAFSERFQKVYDTMDVRLKFGNDQQLVYRDGQPYAQWLTTEGKELADLGWRLAFVPIPRNMTDETIGISIQNWNRNDGWFNTWTQVTDVRVWEPYQVYLPQITGGVSTPTATKEDIEQFRNLFAHATQRMR